MLTAFNHLTLSVSNLSRSFDFYSNLVGLKPEAIWNTGAYLSLAELWVCLSLSGGAISERTTTYTHYAFSIRPEDLDQFKKRLLEHGVHAWQQNSSEGDSFYFLDPDGHQLEAHVGTLTSRLVACKRKPYDGMKFFS
ncbi:VOC family protein [Janthinobacterium sp. PC23-8]|uniref:VOC family protein n=1 Tax=Janthinobacterium sp. PC23-8 TaxID=2012679 RepID=UPI000B966F41|nr:VOC family protein [Janthinobacterium sp. PC23-8]OYO26377.1 glutathione transferase [Janthinobacterium sp. PC23-8]